MKAEILELIIEIGEKKHYLAYAEAEALYHALAPIFGKTTWLSDPAFGGGRTGTTGTLYATSGLCQTLGTTH